LVILSLPQHNLVKLVGSIALPLCFVGDMFINYTHLLFCH
jgi:hypothetical protein